MKIKFLDALLATAVFCVVISGFAYTWTPLNTSFGVVSMSADGRIVCSCPSTSGNFRISRDWGQTWSIATNAPPGGSIFDPVALSADGSRIIVCLSSNDNLHRVFRSTDFGTNWTLLNLPSLSGVFNCYCLASSADGSNLIAGGNSAGAVYFSTNGGANWSISSAPNANWTTFDSSADARQILGIVSDGHIYASTNFGADWTLADFPVQGWKSACISADGKSKGATGANTYISRNGGAILMTNKINGGSIACSANGMTWMIGGAMVYTSSDGGVTWVTNLSNGGWSGTMSADGCEIVVDQSLSFGGGLTNWVGRVTPSPQLNVQTTDGNASVFWLLPSTNFVLQQNSDLSTTNWLTISANPTLNFSNLQQRISVPLSESNGFFRLLAQ
jgi:hypothetical protein